MISLMVPELGLSCDDRQISGQTDKQKLTSNKSHKQTLLKTIPPAFLVSGTIYPSTSLLHLRCLSSEFRSRLKTHLFTVSYPSAWPPTVSSFMLHTYLLTYLLMYLLIYLLIYLLTYLRYILRCAGGIISGVFKNLKRGSGRRKGLPHWCWSSVHCRGTRHFCPKIMCEKLTKCPNFT